MQAEKTVTEMANDLEARTEQVGGGIHRRPGETNSRYAGRAAAWQRCSGLLPHLVTRLRTTEKKLAELGHVLQDPIVSGDSRAREIGRLTEHLAYAYSPYVPIKLATDDQQAIVLMYGKQLVREYHDMRMHVRKAVAVVKKNNELNNYKQRTHFV